MSSVVISGDTSGTVTLTVPTVAGSNTVTLPAVTGTVVISGQNSAITSGTAVASTSGTNIDFTSIPSWVKRITVMFNNVSTNGTNNILVQLGSGSVTTTGYTSYATSGTSAFTNSTGLLVTGAFTAANTINGLMTICLITGNTWVENAITQNNTGTAAGVISTGSIALSGTLDRVRITTIGGTDTFDAGTVNILYE
jgi:hypothetical protein